jgi:hypothetical protein
MGDDHLEHFVEHFVGPAEGTTAQSSYPLKSENAIPHGDFSGYLSYA